MPGDNCSGNIFIGHLKFKLNLRTTQGRLEIWLDITVNNLTITISKIIRAKVKLLPERFLETREPFLTNYIRRNILMQVSISSITIPPAHP